MSGEQVDHPAHYGGADNPYEAIKVIEAWGLGFNIGNTVKYLSRAGKKGDRLEDLRKALWYLQREVDNGSPEGSSPSPMTDDEHAAVTACADAWAAICRVVGDGRTRGADLGEVVFHVHALQHFVMAQAAARCYPDMYRLAGETLTGNEHSSKAGGDRG